jgi:hypothetical protein
MTYYDGKKRLYDIDGLHVRMTEEEAEKFQAENPEVDIQYVPERTKPLPDEAADDYLDCTCQPDPIDGTAPLCNACRLYFESLRDD